MISEWVESERFWWWWWWWCWVVLHFWEGGAGVRGERPFVCLQTRCVLNSFHFCAEVKCYFRAGGVVGR